MCCAVLSVLSRSVVSNSLQPVTVARLPCPWGFSRQEYWSWLPCLSPGDPQLRDRTQVSHIAGGFFTIWAHHGSPRILKWIAYPFSKGSFQPRKGTGASCIADRFFIRWATREAHYVEWSWLDNPCERFTNKRAMPKTIYKMWILQGKSCTKETVSNMAWCKVPLTNE